MRSFLFGSLALSLVGALWVVGCGDSTATGGGGNGGSSDNGGNPSTGGNPTTGGNPSVGGGGNPTTGGGGAGGGIPTDCTEITVDKFRLVDTQNLPDGIFDGDQNPDAGDPDLQDIYQLELYDAVTGSYDLAGDGSGALGDDGNYATCINCVRVFQDPSPDAPIAKQFFQLAGTIDYGASATPFISGSMTDVTLIEVTIDDSFVSTPVPGGECLHVTNLAFDIQQPPDTWTCPPEFYGDGVGCECFDCGEADPDCSDPNLPITTCEDGQTCSADGHVCEGAPTAWTDAGCAAGDYDGGIGNGCQCDCGVQDPDCDLAPAEIVSGCPLPTDTCVGGFCFDDLTWTCDSGFFADGTCDCGCGQFDEADCADATSASCDFCDDTGSCDEGVACGDAASNINATNNAVCN